MKQFATLLLICITQITFAQRQNPVQWNFSHSSIQGNEYELKFSATVGDGWYIYSQDIEGDGPIPTTVEIFEGDHFEKIGSAQEIGDKKEGFDKTFKMNIAKFSKKVLYKQKVKVTDLSQPIDGYVEFMVCNDEMCLPPTEAEFSFDLSSTGTLEVPVSSDEDPAESKKRLAGSTTTPAAEPKDQEVKELEKIQRKSDSKSTLLNNKIIAKKTPTQQEPVKWSFEKQLISENRYKLIFQADIHEDWYLYGQEIEDGPEPTTFTFNEDDPFSLSGQMQESDNVVVKHDKVFDVEIPKFRKYGVFTQEVEITDATDQISGYLSFMTCNDEMCLPPRDVDFHFNFKEGASAVTSTEKNDPFAVGEFDSRRAIDESDYLADCGDPEEESSSLFSIFILGFLGGLLALLTPCVFPMIPMTVSFFTKGGGGSSKAIRDAVIFGLSIIVIYVGLGIILTSIFGPTVLNDMATNVYFNILFFVVFVVFAFSFFGYFEITLPSSWTNKSDQAADSGGLIGIFFMAFTLALVSFSCTGPLIGTLLVQTVQNLGPEDMLFGLVPIKPLIGMFGFSLALALPFTLFAAFPAWLKSLPQSGSWMTNLKVTLGFLELALALKFLSIADLVPNMGILKFELFLGLWVLIFLGLGLYHIGILKFPHDPKKPKIGIGRGAMSLMSFALVGYLAYSLFTYQSLRGVLSGFAPPVHYNFFKPGKCPYGLDCYKDFDEGLAVAKEKNKPVFVDFTGHGCVNCRKVEENVWIDQEIQDKIRNEFVLISLYVDDKQRLFPDDKRKYLIDKNNGEKLRTVGRKWASFQINNFNRSSQPYYVLMDNDGTTLLNKPIAYTEDKVEYLNFLNCGLSAFEQLSMK